MATSTTSKITAALVATLMASAGGAAFLHKHPNPTLREVFLACEKGDVSGIACCEDMNAVKDWTNALASCGMVTPTERDPLGYRKMEEDKFDADLAEGK